MSGQQQLSIRKTVAQWWSDTRARNSFGQTARQFATKMWEFIRDSTPQRKKQRYGDADYDWEQHVNTTSATVSWHDRLLGQFLSPYQPTEPALFREMLDAVDVDFSQFTFIDIGSGKGRTLLMASDYAFRRILGVEIVPELHAGAVANIASFRSDSQKCFTLESQCLDARALEFPSGNLLLYLFNPLPEPALAEMLARLNRSLTDQPRQIVVIYHNPELQQIFEPSRWKKIGGTHQYSVFVHLPLE